MVACGFNTLAPALILSLQLFRQNEVGVTNVGYRHYNDESIGTLKSVEGYNTTVNATVVHLDDFFSLDGDNKQFTMEPRGLLRTDDDNYIGVHSKGVFTESAAINRLLNDKGDSATDWGSFYSASWWTFDVNRTGPYQDLGNSMFVGNLRFAPGKYKGKATLDVEFRLSKITPGPRIHGDCPGDE